LNYVSKFVVHKFDPTKVRSNELVGSILILYMQNPRSKSNRF